VASKKKAVAPPQKVALLGINKDVVGYLYYVDRQGNVVRMQRGIAKAKTEIIAAAAVVRERGFDYYLDDDGDVVCEPE
jgi:hypothetical protein